MGRYLARQAESQVPCSRAVLGWVVWWLRRRGAEPWGKEPGRDVEGKKGSWNFPLARHRKGEPRAGQSPVEWDGQPQVKKRNMGPGAGTRPMYLFFARQQQMDIQSKKASPVGATLRAQQRVGPARLTLNHVRLPYPA